MKNNNNLPKFFNYQGEGGTENGYETIQDFFLSWTLRCAPDFYKQIDPNIQRISKAILFFLVYGNKIKNTDDFEISEVTTRRQEKRIDLLVFATVKNDGVEKKYVLNIENKRYTKTTESQLKAAKTFVENQYAPKGYEIRNLVIFCDDTHIGKDSNEREKCTQLGYFCTHIGELKEVSGIDDSPKTLTGNYLFDEYWFNM